MLQCLNIQSKIITIQRFYNMGLSPYSEVEFRCRGKSKFFQGKNTKSHHWAGWGEGFAYRDTGVTTLLFQAARVHHSVRRRILILGSQECGNNFSTTETVVSPRLRKAKEKLEGSG